MIRVIKVTENLLFTAAVFIMACSLICQIAGLKPVVVLSGSMEPAIKTGSLAFIDTSDRTVFKGDVISFRAGELLVTHRVIDVTEEGYRTKGDNNDISDGVTTTAQNFRGETLFSVPYLGYGLVYLQQPAGFAIACVILVTVIILNVLDSISERKEKREKKEMETADSDM